MAPPGSPAVQAYEQVLAPLRKADIALLEIAAPGTGSLGGWRAALPRASVVGLEGEAGGDAAVVDDLRRREAPAGFDVVIDRTGRSAAERAASLAALFDSHLRPGGLYLIEGWDRDAGSIGDAGTPGLLKRLVDHLAAERIRATSPGIGAPLPVESMMVLDGLAVLRRVEA